ncbi:MAG: hypothetical protein FWD17_15395 [Polyangiaceae bacterium]|nr:hypothetical protein [Polyangiaceae bacterium]
MAVTPAPPPNDDGQPAEGGKGGTEHVAALEELHVGALGWRTDRQRSVRLPLPDADHWLRVKFWGMQSLLGFRYGKDHHAIVGGTIVHVDDETAPQACDKAFEHQAAPLIESFEVTLEHDAPRATTWKGRIVDIDSLVATTATLGMRDQYAVAYATYPAWKGACLVVGIAVPARNELGRARAVCERFVADVLPHIEVLSHDEPRERY